MTSYTYHKKKYAAEFKWKIYDFLDYINITNRENKPPFTLFSTRFSTHNNDEGRFRLKLTVTGPYLNDVVNIYLCWEEYEKTCMVNVQIKVKGVEKFDKLTILRLKKETEDSYNCWSYSAKELRQILFGDVTIVCSLNIREDMTTSQLVYKPNGELSINSELNKFDDFPTDLTINVDGHKFQAHKFLLILCSSVFQNVLDNGNTIDSNSETSECTINLTDVTSEIFDLISNYIYTDELDHIDHSDIVDISKTAEKYKIQDLTKQCAEFLSKSRHTNNDSDDSW